MRGVLAVLGVLGLTAALYLGLRPVLHRPPLRVALELRAGDADDAALAAGVALAIEERDGIAGPWRVTAAHQIRHPNGQVEFPTPRAHTMLYGLQTPNHLPGPAGPLVSADPIKELTLIQEWMRVRGLEGLSTHFPPDRSGPLVPRKPGILEGKPAVIRILSRFDDAGGAIQELREAGYPGPIFIRPGGRTWARDLGNQESAYYVLTPHKAPPSGFRHPHPFAFVGYRGAQRYFDALDKDPKADPLHLSFTFRADDLFAERREEPRIYQVRKGRLTPE